MSQTLIPLKWQPLGQGLFRPINPPCCLEQVCKGVECRQNGDCLWLLLAQFFQDHQVPSSCSSQSGNSWPGSPCSPSPPIPGDKAKWQRSQFPGVNKQAVYSQKQSRGRDRQAGRSRSSSKLRFLINILPVSLLGCKDNSGPVALAGGRVPRHPHLTSSDRKSVV